MTKLQKIGIILPLIAVIATPMMVAAQGRTDLTGVPTTPEEVETLFGKILGWLYTFFFILAGVMILVAAFQYLTAGGDEEKVKKAKNTLIYAIIAIAVALVAMGIDNIIAGVLDIGGVPAD